MRFSASNTRNQVEANIGNERRVATAHIDSNGSYPQ
jgi:hypothetical protein